MGNNVNLQINSSVEVGGDEGEAVSVTTGESERDRGLKKRLSSWALWAAVLGLAGLLLEATGVFARLGVTDETWRAIIAAVGAVLSAFGIVNDPTTRNKI